MGLFERYPRLAWPAMALLTVVLGGLAVMTFLNYAASPTDENLFANPPDSLFLYVTKDVPGVPVKMTITGAYQPTTEADSLHVGDLLKRIDMKQLVSMDDLSSTLKSIGPDSSVVLHAYRPKSRSFLNLRVTRRMIPDSAAAFLKDFICVIDVTPGGASDRAGMKVGDLLVSINGKTFTNAAGADVIMRRGQSGKTIIYEAIRDNERLTLDVTLASFGFPLGLLILSFSGMFMMGTGAFISLRRPRLRAARAVGLALLLLGYGVTVATIRREPDLTLLLRIRDFLVGFSCLAGAATAAWSRMFFPKERPDLVSRHWIGWGAVSLTTVSIVLWRLL
ncbi:MAG TPA: PDZ domain-containing protein, partial [Bacteroidota bacterium]|nr:PDZ domain-containing protein [Bacteroidota bacterium]